MLPIMNIDYENTILEQEIELALKAEIQAEKELEGLEVEDLEGTLNIDSKASQGLYEQRLAERRATLHTLAMRPSMASMEALKEAEDKAVRASMTKKMSPLVGGSSMRYKRPTFSGLPNFKKI